jgi:hypothetical protein
LPTASFIAGKADEEMRSEMAMSPMGILMEMRSRKIDSNISRLVKVGARVIYHARR